MQYCGIDENLIDKVYDKSNLKKGDLLQAQILKSIYRSISIGKILIICSYFLGILNQKS